MIKMYVMQTCPDCEYVEKQVEGNPNFKVIDIGKHVRNLKEFLKLRDTHPASAPSHSIRRMWDWSPDRRRREPHAVSTEEDAE